MSEQQSSFFERMRDKADGFVSRGKALNKKLDDFDARIESKISKPVVRTINGALSVAVLAAMAYVGNRVVDTMGKDVLEPQHTIRDRLESSTRYLRTPKLTVDNFELSSYQPPEDLGKVTEKVERDKKGKTILYLPDTHTQLLDGLYKGEEYTHNIQVEQFGIMEDFIRKHGKLVLVQESFRDGFSVDELRFIIKKGRFSPTENEVLAAIENENDFEKKHALSEEALRLGKTTPPYVLMLLYPDKVTLVGTLNKEQDKEVERQENSLTRLVSFRLDPEKAKCDAPSTMNLLEAETIYKSTHPTAEAIDCYCEYRANEVLTLFTLSTKRMINAADWEMDRALHYPANVIFVRAGSDHGSYSRELMDRAGVNYAFVLPRSSRAEAQVSDKKHWRDLSYHLKPENFFPDPKKVCPSVF